MESALSFRLYATLGCGGNARTNPVNDRAVGHCWTGTIPDDHDRLLPGSDGYPPSVRRYG